MPAKKKAPVKKASKKKAAPKKATEKPKEETRGRKTVYADDVGQIITDALRYGWSIRKTAKAAGISEATLRNWIKGKAPKRLPEGTDKVFFRTLKRMQLLGELRLLKQVELGLQGWQSKGWLLEKTRKAEYGRSIEVSHKIPLEVLEKMSDEQLDEVIRTGTTAAANVLDFAKGK